MNATLSFDLPEHAHDHLCAVHGGLFWSALWDLDNYLRSYVKHAPEGRSKEAIDLAEEIRREYILDVLALVEGVSG